MFNRRHLLGVAPAMAIATLIPDHSLAGGSLPSWDGLLAKYVRAGSDGLNRVDYAGWKANAADMAAYMREWRDLWPGTSPLVLRPANTDEVSRILKIAYERKILFP